jgi:hypothetical protein
VIPAQSGATPYNDGEGACNTSTPQETIDTINASFPDGDRVVNVQSVAGAHGFYEYVGSDMVTRSGHVLAHDEVWVERNGKVYAVTGSARHFSAPPDANGHIAVDDGQAAIVIECVETYR